MTTPSTPRAKITIADIEKVPAAEIMDMMSEMFRNGKEANNEMLISLSKVPLICFHIESIEENMAKIVIMIERNWEMSQKQHEGFVRKDELQSFSAIYVSEFSTLKKTIYGCTGAIMLTILANFITRFASF